MAASLASAGGAAAHKIMAQKAVAEVKAAHHKITGLELAATRSNQESCKTIAAAGQAYYFTARYWLLITVTFLAACAWNGLRMAAHCCRYFSASIGFSIL